MNNEVIPTFPEEELLPYMKRKQVIRSLKQLNTLVKKMQTLEEFAFDTETNTLRVYSYSPEFKCVGISITWGYYNNYYIPVGHIFDDNQIPLEIVVRKLKPIFERDNIRIIGHNLKFDLHVLARIGINVKTNDLFDTMIASWICDENTQNGLKYCTQEILKIKQTKIDEVFNTVTKEDKKAVGLKASSKATFDLTRIDIASSYAIADSYYTWLLYIHFLDELHTQNMEKIYFKIYPRFLKVLFDMEEKGVVLDIDKCRKMDEQMQEDLDNLEYEMLELIGLDMKISSGQQLAQLLFGYDEFKTVNQDLIDFNFGFTPISYTAKGVPQTNTETLKKLARSTFKNSHKMIGVKFCQLLLEYKKIAKLQSFTTGFIDVMYPDGKIHCNFNPIGTTSGRISCSNPNLMQVPNGSEEDKYNIRDLFIGDLDPTTNTRDRIISVDFSNLEVRIMAHFSLDKGLIDAFLENKDLHGNTAKLMFQLDCDANEVKKKYPQLRQQGKIIAFLLQYGGSVSALEGTLNSDGGLDSMIKEIKDCGGKNLPKHLSPFSKCKKPKDIAQTLMDMYFDAFPGIAKFMKQQKKFAHRNGVVYTILGRKRNLPMIYSSNKGEVSYAERLSLNAPIQGTGADIMINAQLNIFENERLKELGCKMLIQVHDELIFSCPESTSEEASQIIRECMIYPFGKDKTLNLPLEVGIGIGSSYGVGH